MSKSRGFVAWSVAGFICAFGVYLAAEQMHGRPPSGTAETSQGNALTVTGGGAWVRMCTGVDGSCPATPTVNTVSTSGDGGDPPPTAVRPSPDAGNWPVTAKQDPDAGNWNVNICDGGACPLPDGACTAANQETANGYLETASNWLTGVNTVTPTVQVTQPVRVQSNLQINDAAVDTTNPVPTAPQGGDAGAPHNWPNFPKTATHTTMIVSDNAADVGLATGQVCYVFTNNSPRTIFLGTSCADLVAGYTADGSTVLGGTGDASGDAGFSEQIGIPLLVGQTLEICEEALPAYCVMAMADVGYGLNVIKKTR